jgi:hypothetical protein
MFYFAAASHSEMARRLGEVGVQVFRYSGIQDCGKVPAAPDVAGPEYLNTRTPEHPNSPLFLRVDHPSFGPAFERLSERLLTGCAGAPDAFTAAVCEAVDPLNVAGLCDPRKRNWYPVDLADLIENAAKLDMSADAMKRRIEVAGWAAFV